MPAYPTNCIPKGDVTLYRAGAYVRSWTGKTAAQRGTALLSSSAASLANDTLVIGPGTFDIASTAITILGGQTFILCGSTITHTDATVNIFNATTVDNWAITGRGTLTGVANTVANECGIKATNCENYVIENLLIQQFGSYGIDLRALSDTTMTTYRKRSKISNVTAFNCQNGFNLGPRCEYNHFDNATAINNVVTGFLVQGGNNFFTNCIAAENYNGIKITNGDNGGHGTWTGGALNHNTNINVWGQAALGFTFAGAAIYGNGSTSGYIYYETTLAKLNFIGCDISAPLAAAGTPAGMNMFASCYLGSGYTSASGTMTAAVRALINWSDCYTSTGPSTENTTIAPGVFANVPLMAQVFG